MDTASRKGRRGSRLRARTLASVAVVLGCFSTSNAVAPTSNYVAGACYVNSTHLATTDDLFPVKAIPKYAQGFTIEYFPTYKVLTNVAGGNLTYVLYQCGTTPPAATPALENATYISVPVTKVAVGGTTYIPRVEQLGERETIVSYFTDPVYITSPCLNVLIATGFTDVANEGCATSTSSYSGANNTVMQDDGVEAAFAYSDSLCYGSPEKLLNAVVISDVDEYGDNQNLKFAEWIKFFSYFYNRESEANTIFDGIEARWLCTSLNVGACTADLAPGNRVSVAWLPGYDPDIGGGVGGWYLPDSDSYYSEALDVAGGNMALCQEGSLMTTYDYVVMSDQEMLACASAASVCILAFSYDTIPAETLALMQNMTCVQNKKVYDNTGQVEADWFENRVAEPDVLLEDLIMALHEDNSLFGIGYHDRVWIRDVYTEAPGVSVSMSECSDTTAPWVVRANECVDVVQDCAATSPTTGDVTTAPVTSSATSTSSWTFRGVLVAVVSISLALSTTTTC